MIGAHFSGSVIGLQLPSIAMKSFVNRIVFLQHLNENSHFHAPLAQDVYSKAKKAPDANRKIVVISISPAANGEKLIPAKNRPEIRVIVAPENRR
jgi:hypothetical protein